MALVKMNDIQNNNQSSTPGTTKSGLISMRDIQNAQAQPQPSPLLTSEQFGTKYGDPAIQNNPMLSDQYKEDHGAKIFGQDVQPLEEFNPVGPANIEKKKGAIPVVDFINSKLGGIVEGISKFGNRAASSALNTLTLGQSKKFMEKNADWNGTNRNQILCW